MTLKLYPGEIKKFTALALIGLVALGVVAYHRVPVGELAINLHEIPYYSVALRYLPYFEPLKPIELIANTPRISAETGGQYPFLVPWAWAAVFALFGENLTTLRFFYLFLYFVFLVGLYLVGETIDRRWGWIIGGTGCFFALTSPFMLYNITSGYAPEEIFVLAFTPLAILAFIRASGSGSTKASIAAGFVPVIGFFVKYSYGFLLFAIYVAAHLLRSALVRTPGRLRVLLLMAAPFSLVLLFYLLSPGGAEFVLKFVTKSRILERDNLAQASQLANLKTAFGQADPLYYFKAVFSRAGHFDYRAGFFVGPLAVGLALLGVATFFATAMRNMRDRGTLILAVFFFLPALGLSFHMVKAKIYMIPFVTGLWLLCGVQVRNWLRWTSMKGQRTTHILSMAALVVLCASVTAGALPYYLRHDREQAAQGDGVQQLQEGAEGHAAQEGGQRHA